MSFWDGVRKMLHRAKEEATDVAQTASLRLDLRSLEGRRDHLFREIGRHVYATRDSGPARSPEIDGFCAEIGDVEQKIAAKKAEMDTARARSRSPRPEAKPSSP